MRVCLCLLRSGGGGLARDPVVLPRTATLRGSWSWSWRMLSCACPDVTRCLIYKSSRRPRAGGGRGGARRRPSVFKMQRSRILLKSFLGSKCAT